MFENETAPLKAYSGYNGRERIRNFKKFIYGLCEINEDFPEHKKIPALKAEMVIFKKEKADEEQNAIARKNKSQEKKLMNEVLSAQENRMDLKPPAVSFASAKMPAAFPVPAQSLAAISASTDMIDLETDDEEVRVVFDDDNENLFNEIAKTLPVKNKKKEIKKRRIASLGSGRPVEEIDRLPSYDGLIHGIATASKNVFDMMAKKNDTVPNHDQTPGNKKTGKLNKLKADMDRTEEAYNAIKKIDQENKNPVISEEKRKAEAKYTQATLAFTKASLLFSQESV